MDWRNPARLIRGALTAGLGRAARPYKLTLALTMRCPYACAFCHGSTPLVCDEAPAEALDELFGRNPDLYWIDLTGGEIFCRADLGRILKALRQRLPRLAALHFPTSGGADLGLVTELVREQRAAMNGRLVVTVSVNGPPELDADLRGDPTAFERSVRTFLALRALAGIDVYFGMTLGTQNIDQVEPTLAALTRLVPGLRRSDLHVNFVNRSTHFFGNPTCPKPDTAQVEKAVAELLARRPRLPRSPLDVLERAFLMLMPLHLATGRSPAPCASLRGNLYVAPNLTLYPCTIWDRPLGNLAEHGFDLAAALASESALAARDLVTADRCPGCWTPCEAFPSLLDPRWPFGLRRQSLRDKRQPLV